MPWLNSLSLPGWLAIDREISSGSNYINLLSPQFSSVTGNLCEHRKVHFNSIADRIFIGAPLDLGKARVLLPLGRFQSMNNLINQLRAFSHWFIHVLFFCVAWHPIYLTSFARLWVLCPQAWLQMVYVPCKQWQCREQMCTGISFCSMSRRLWLDTFLLGWANTQHKKRNMDSPRVKDAHKCSWELSKKPASNCYCSYNPNIFRWYQTTWQQWNYINRKGERDPYPRA